MNLIKLSLAVVVLGLAAGCGKQDVPVTDPAAAPAPVEAPEAATAPPAPVLVALMDYDASVTPAVGGNCALDAINGAAVTGASLKVGSEAMFSGWIGDATNQVPTEARLILKGAEKAYSAPLVAGGERPDVATALGAESMRFSGYNVLAKLDVVPGTYELSIVHGPANATASCPPMNASPLNASLIVTD